MSEKEGKEVGECNVSACPEEEAGEVRKKIKKKIMISGGKA